jgi:transcriptional regulator
MYSPPHNRPEDAQEVAAFMREFPFASLVTHGPSGMTATHLPLNLSEGCDSLVMTGHVAKANRQWEDLAGGREAMAIFSGPHAYVSPTHYEPGQWVPTWNYVAVHAYGTPAIIEAREGKLAVLRQTVSATEPTFQNTFDALPPEFVDAKLKGIVAFEIAVTRTEARFKLSQDRRADERGRISLALRLSGDDSAERLAAYMERRAPVVAG